MQVVGQTTDTNWLATGLNKDSSYWFSVRAVHSRFPRADVLSGTKYHTKWWCLYGLIH